MKIILESTEKIIEINGHSTRVWEGHTESGIAVHCFISRIAISDQEPEEEIHQFKKELQECRPPSPEIAAYPLRIIL